MTTTATSLGTATDASVRLGALAGIAGPLLFSIAFLAQNLLRSDDDAVAEPVSALEAGDLGWVQQVNFVVFGALMLVFAMALHRTLSSDAGRLGASLLAVSACGLFMAAAFPLREDSDGEVYDPGYHFYSGVTFFLGSALALLVLSRAFARDPHWHSLSTYALVAGLFAIAGFVLLGRFAIPDDAPLHDVAGLLQRAVILLVTFPCLVAIGHRLRRISRA